MVHFFYQNIIIVFHLNLILVAVHVMTEDVVVQGTILHQVPVQFSTQDHVLVYKM